MAFDPTNTRVLYSLCWNTAILGSDESWNNLREFLNGYKNDETRWNEATSYADTYQRTPLHWILRSHSPPLDVVEMLLMRHTSPKTLLQMKDRDGMLPLHQACWSGAAPEIVETLLKAYPASVQVKDNVGNLPLHCTCYRGASLRLVSLLLDAFPRSVQVRDNFGWLPIHWACYRGAPLDVLNILVEKYPESLHIKVSDKKPSQFLGQCVNHNDEDDNMSFATKGKQYKFLLHRAAAGRYSVHLVKLLLEAFPNSCTIQDCNGMVPLHHACVNALPESMDVVMVLLHAANNNNNSDTILTWKDNQGRTPSQLLQSIASRSDTNGKLLLHHQASKDSFTATSLILLFHAHPESIVSPDNLDMLPFHHACLNTTSSLELLMLFLKLNPETIAFHMQALPVMV